MDTTTIKTLYVFVEIAVDRAHLAASIRLNFPQCIPSPSGNVGSSTLKGKGPELEISIEATSPSVDSPAPLRPTKLAVVGTIQFVAAVQGLKIDLEAEAPEEVPVNRLAIEGAPSTTTVSAPEFALRPKANFEVDVPQVKPLSPGEILGCTAPRLARDTDALMCVYLNSLVLGCQLTRSCFWLVPAMSATVVSISNQS